MLTAVAAPSHAQFLPREFIEPQELAAQKIPADRAAPTAAQLQRMKLLEENRLRNLSCNAMSATATLDARRESLSLYESTFGPDHPATARPLLALACHLAYTKSLTAMAERESIAERLIQIGRKRRQKMALLLGLDTRINLRIERENTGLNVADATEAHAIAGELVPVVSVIIAHTARVLASALEAAGRVADAEPYWHEAETHQEAVRPENPFRLAALYERHGDNLIAQFRADDARIWYDRAVKIYEKAVSGASPDQLSEIAAYAQRLAGKAPTQIEALYRAVLAGQEQLPASSDAANWMSLWNLAKSARVRGDLKTAIMYQRRVIAALGPKQHKDFELELAGMLQQREEAPEAERIYRRRLETDSDNPAVLESLGGVLQSLGRTDEAFSIRRRAVEIATRRFGPSDRETVRLNRNLGVSLWMLNRHGDALPYLEAELAGWRSELASIRESANEEYRHNLRNWVSERASYLLKLHWQNRNDASKSGQDDSRARGFEIAQLAHPSVSSAAFNETSARELASRAGKTDAFAAWAKARDGVAALDSAISLATKRGAEGDAERIRLSAERLTASERLTAHAAALRRALPSVFERIRPEPVSIAALSDATSAGPLRDDEAVVLLFPGMPKFGGEVSRGVVFAVARGQSAWAEIPIDGADMSRHVDELHEALANPAEGGKTLPLGSPKDANEFLRYDRALAHRLYRAFFGHREISSVLANKKRWIVVPEGPLLALNFAALVSQPPPGGVEGDVDPSLLRQTAWLGLDKVIAVLPSVNALEIARKSPPPAMPKLSFFGIGDPAFRGVADPPPAPEQAGSLSRRGAVSSSREPRSPAAAQRFYLRGAGQASALAELNRLEYSDGEVRKLGALLKAAPEHLLLQLDATERQVERHNAAGTMANAGVVLFSTHALLSGDFDGALVEPALALTPGRRRADGMLDPSDDGLLTSSEVARLRLNASLVILSACNTAAAGANGGEGFSGLTRAFLQAGARAVLATHAPVPDQAGERLTTYTVERMVQSGGNVADSLRNAMRSLAADQSLDARGTSFAHPHAWAAFVAIDPY
ncbi:CHAT domain-containing tetratricopeptide repeat protein [Rubrivivax gelatinosus]|nr:CHAT domain-containing tetratricopeptide repeat protein [Rubrivivax gelatinosus]